MITEVKSTVEINKAIPCLTMKWKSKPCVCCKQAVVKLEVERRTIMNLLRWYRQTGSISDHLRHEWPFVTTPHEHAHTRKHHFRDRCTTAATTTRLLIWRHGRSIRSRTVSRLSKWHGICYIRPYKWLQFKQHHRCYIVQRLNQHRSCSSTSPDLALVMRYSWSLSSHAWPLWRKVVLGVTGGNVIFCGAININFRL